MLHHCDQELTKIDSDNATSPALERNDSSLSLKPHSNGKIWRLGLIPLRLTLRHVLEQHIAKTDPPQYGTCVTDQLIMVGSRLQQSGPNG